MQRQKKMMPKIFYLGIIFFGLAGEFIDGFAKVDRAVENDIVSDWIAKHGVNSVTIALETYRKEFFQNNEMPFSESALLSQLNENNLADNQNKNEKQEKVAVA